MPQFTGRVALITGAAQGIGYAVAERLSRDGIAVGIADIHRDKAIAAAKSLEGKGAPVAAIGIDVADAGSIAKGLARLSGELGAATILINNAGIYKSTPLLDEGSVAAWHSSLEVMLTGSLLMARAITPGMIEAKQGRIINLGSMMSNVAFGEDAAYCAAKAGILGLTRSLAAELAAHNICVNAICPGNILTDMLEQTAAAIEQRDGLEPGAWLRERARDIPLGRLGKPGDIAGAIAFLCGEDADYITGQALHVNGGLYQW